MWIELHDTARDHPKILKLARDLGIRPVHALGHMVSLWTWVLRMAPDGCLESFDEDDVELAAQWDGERGKFFATLISRKLIDSRRGGHIIHDWEDFAGSLKSAARAREYRARKHDSNETITSPSRDSTVISRRPTRPDQTDQTRPTRPDQTDPECTAVLAVIGHYRKHHPERFKHPKPSSEGWRKVRDRLREGFTVEQLCKAIDGCHKTPHNTGDNDTGEKWLDLELITRDEKHVHRFVANDDHPPERRVLTKATRSVITAGQQWLAQGNHHATK